MYESFIFLFIIIGFLVNLSRRYLPKLVAFFFLIIFVFGFSSSMSYKNNVNYFSAEEMDTILESKEEFNVILASSVDAFGQQPPYTLRPGSEQSTGLFGSPQPTAPGSSGGDGPSSTGSESGSKKLTSGGDGPLPGPTPIIPIAKTRKIETKEEKEKRELKESFEAEKLLNAKRRKQGLPEITVIIKDGKRYFVPRPQVRKKYYHFPTILNTKPPSQLPVEILNKLADSKITSYSERRLVLDSTVILPEEAVIQAADDLRKAIIDSETKVRQGRFGVKMSQNGKIDQPVDGTILYNRKKNQAFFFDANGFRTCITPTRPQWKEIINNNNML